ncbi:hypothetical protein EZV62_002009 [Acer yangbiense]|uniref:CRAL-TRIO domain-containing protein n=1 Tax=Acer yangbiense TaxID=1000413 RepID=A0A5C7IVU5_9ROSI|nr:hypothetical protein EZV62_002009 [Acer yangbiense]
MTVEVKVEETQMSGDEVAVVIPTKEEEPKTVEKCSSFKEESNYLSDLKEFERKALDDLKSRLEEAILGNTLFNKPDQKKTEKTTTTTTESEKKETEKPVQEEEEEAKPVEEEAKTEAEEEKEKTAEENDEAEKKEHEEEEKGVAIDNNVELWGVPLLPSKLAEGIDVVLLKFLRAREFKVNDAFEMLKKTLQWRNENNIDSILEEDHDLGSDLSFAAYMNGIDREGHPVCYNVYGVFEKEELYQKTFGTEEKRSQFLRWRLRLMEKGIQKLNLKPGGVSSLLQINDLKNSPGISKKELRISMKQAVNLLQDNYPEFVARNIFINVPFWYYALNALLSPFLTQRTKSKFVVARPAKVTETLLKYIPAEEIPVQYGGFKRENDFEFCNENGVVSEITMKAGSTETIEISADEVGGAAITWEVSVLGWEVNYKEEFVPTDEGSYTVIIQKGKKIVVSQDEPIRNTFRNNEPGKVVITIQNGSSKKKRVFYRYKIKNSPF